MIIADTSAWVEYLRRTGSPVNLVLRRLLRGSELATTEPVRLEILAGARDHRHEGTLRRLLARPKLRRVDAHSDWDRAAQIYADARWRGVTLRSHVDCLIAAVALRTGDEVLHFDRDFEHIASLTGLTLTQT